MDASTGDKGCLVRPADQSRQSWLERATTVEREMAPSSKSEKDASKQKSQRKHKDHVVKLLMRGKVGMNSENVWY